MVETIQIENLLSEEPNRLIGDLSHLIQNIDKIGVVNPPTVAVFPNGERRVIAGERRIRAAKACGLNEVDCCVRVMPEDAEEALVQTLILRFSENHHRKDVHPVEEAELVTRFKELSGLTDEEIGEQLGMKRWRVQDCLSIGRLPENERTRLRSKAPLAFATVAEYSRLPDETRPERLDLLLKQQPNRASLRAMRSREAASDSGSVSATAEPAVTASAQNARSGGDEPMRQGANARAEIEQVANSRDPLAVRERIVLENEAVSLTIQPKQDLDLQSVLAEARSLLEDRERSETGGAA